MKYAVATYIMNQEAEPDVKAEALRLLWTGKLGESNGPAQQCLNYAVVDCLCDLRERILLTPQPKFLDLVFRARAVKDIARTQRTKYLPPAFLAVIHAWQDFLDAVYDYLPSHAPESIRHEARRARLIKSEATLTALDFQLYRERETPIWKLQRVSTRQRADAYMGVGVLSSRSVTFTVEPLYEMRLDGSIRQVGHGLRMFFRRSPQCNEKWVNTFSPRGEAFCCEYYNGQFSAVGRYKPGTNPLQQPVGTFLSHAFPGEDPSQTEKIRQGDLVLSKTDDVEPRNVYPSSLHALEQFTSWEIPSSDEIEEVKQSTTHHIFYIWVKAKIQLPHRNHPPIVVGKGIWRIDKVAERVRPVHQASGD